WDLENGSAGIGAWIGLIGALAIGVGAYESSSGIGALRAPRAPRAGAGVGARPSSHTPPAARAAGGCSERRPAGRAPVVERHGASGRGGERGTSLVRVDIVLARVRRGEW